MIKPAEQINDAVKAAEHGIARDAIPLISEEIKLLAAKTGIVPTEVTISFVNYGTIGNPIDPYVSDVHISWEIMF